MRSIPLAMIWEMLYHGRWMLIAGVLAGNLLPLILEGALQHQGATDDPQAPGNILIHIMLVQINMFVFGSAVISAQGKPSRLYTSPIPTSTIVIWHLLPGMVLMAVEYILSALALNYMFGLQWPLWGPALFAAVSVAAVNAVVWQTEKTAWLPFILGTVAATLGLWYKGRHGDLFAGPMHDIRFGQMHFWDHVTVSEVFMLLATAAISYYAAIKGVARNRRGDTLRPLGIVAWLQKVLDDKPDVGAAFRSPEEAQFWAVWRQKGWAMPACVTFGMVMGFGFWLLNSRNPYGLLQGALVGGGMLSFVGLLGGVVLGNSGPDDGNFAMGSFAGTRPMASRIMSRIILKVAARSAWYSWCIWAVASATVYLILRTAGFGIPQGLPEGIDWWYFPATILGLWIVLGIGSSLGLTGRNWFCGGAIVGGLAIFVGGMLLSELTLSTESRLVFGQIVCAVVGVAFVLSTAWAYLAARRQSLIESSSLYKAALGWLVLSLPVVSMGILRPVYPLPNYVFVVGLMALAVAPFSTIPLALSWNRIR